MSNETTTTDIDTAIAAAKARVSKNSGSDASTTDKPKRKRLTDEERAQRTADYEKAKADRKAAREAKRAAKLAEYEANRKPAHMAKVNKAAEKLPTLTADAEASFNTVTGELSPADIFVLSEHLTHYVRAQRTQAALDMNLNVGDKVRVLSGNPRAVGQVGFITKAQRIRCFVQLEGSDKDIYLFSSDVEVLEAAAIQEVPADTEESTAVAS
jgi:hypothetical protein